MLVGIKHFLGNIKTNFEYLFLNYFVTNIPVWTIRKLFYGMFGMKIGKHARIMMKTIVQQPRNITIGENAIINEYCFLDGRGGLEIGKNASISIYTIILTGSHDKNSTEFAYRTGKVIIKNNVWIGARAIILDRSVLEDACIIGAGSTFKGHAQKNGIYAGNPAKLAGERKLEEFYDINYRPFFR